MNLQRLQPLVCQPSLCIGRADCCLGAFPVPAVCSFSGLQGCPRKMRKVISFTYEGVSLTDPWEAAIKERAKRCPKER